MDALELFDVLGNLDMASVAEEALSKHEEIISTYNQLQLYDGKRSDGRDIFPTYLDDPYFTTRAAAQKYSDWKDKITPNRRRTPGVPNLYINGYFHSTIEAKVQGTDVIIQSSWGVSADIEGKFSEDIYGLNEDSRESFIDQFLNATFEEIVVDETGLNFKK